jgi:hypothetical protein
VLAVRAHGKETDLPYANMRAVLDGGGRGYPTQVGAQQEVRMGLKDGRFTILTPPKPAR